MSSVTSLRYGRYWRASATWIADFPPPVPPARMPYVQIRVPADPAGRVDVAVGPFAEGETIQVESLKYYRGTIARSKAVTFATVRVGAAAPSAAVRHSSTT